MSVLAEKVKKLNAGHMALSKDIQSLSHEQFMELVWSLNHCEDVLFRHVALEIKRRLEGR